MLLKYMHIVDIWKCTYFRTNIAKSARISIIVQPIRRYDIGHLSVDTGTKLGNSAALDSTRHRAFIFGVGHLIFDSVAYASSKVMVVDFVRADWALVSHSSFIQLEFCKRISAVGP